MSKTTESELPPMVNEPNQAEVDGETAHRLRAAAEERRRIAEQEKRRQQNQ